MATEDIQIIQRPFAGHAWLPIHADWIKQQKEKSKAVPQSRGSRPSSLSLRIFSFARLPYESLLPVCRLRTEFGAVRFVYSQSDIHPSLLKECRLTMKYEDTSSLNSESCATSFSSSMPLRVCHSSHSPRISSTFCS